MADVTDRDRGQLILVTGVILAVALVGLALVLNSVIYTENLATRNQEHESNNLLVDRSNVRAEMADSIVHVNDDVSTSTKFDWLEQNLSDSVGTRERRVVKQAALGGRLVNYTLLNATGGTRIKQTDASRNFTAGGGMAGDDDWVVVEDTETLRYFRISANRSTLYESTMDTTKAALADSAFNVNVTDANGDTWRVYMFRGAVTNNVYILTEDPTEPSYVGNLEAYQDFVTESCSYSNETVNIWMLAAVVENSQCDQLSFLEDDAVGPLTIRYDNAIDDGTGAARIRGTYDLLVDEDISRIPSPYYLSTDGRSPFTQQAIVEAQIQMHYQSQRTEYYTEIDAEPTNPAPVVTLHGPEVGIWDIGNDNSDAVTGIEYEMDWSVSDEDGDLDRVKLYLVENGTSVVLDSETIDVSGRTASGTTTLNSTALDGLKYRLEIVVLDEETASDNDIVVDTADGTP